MLQNFNTDNSNVKHISSDNVVILRSMKDVSTLSISDCSANTNCSCSPFASQPKNQTLSDPLDSYTKPGYIIAHFVEKFISTDAGQIPVVSRKLSLKDRVSTLWARAGFTRNNYKIVPGLYAVGEPDQNSEVLVTANFKLTFDILRTNLNELNVWILVLNTFGVNVWCAAGKGTFSTQELSRMVKFSGVEKVVKHRRLILPQLSATGVRAADVKKLSGFTVIFGPIRASDIQMFIKNGRIAQPYMRHVTFDFKERLILTPIELNIAFKPAVIAALSILLISGISPQIFSLKGVWDRGIIAIISLLFGILSGTLITPAALPFLPFKSFAAKGVVSGAIFAFCALFISSAFLLPLPAIAALYIFGIVVSSWFAMSFTGATPFTSPSGVEKEMKRFIPIQAGGLLLSLVLWIYSAF